MGCCTSSSPPGTWVSPAHRMSSPGEDELMYRKSQRESRKKPSGWLPRFMAARAVTCGESTVLKMSCMEYAMMPPFSL